MEKSERYRAAVAGQPVDRAPVGCWIHYGSALWPADLVADVHLRFFDEYDWDYIKVMNDFRLDLPDGIVEVRAPDDLDGVGSGQVTYRAHDQQIDVLTRVRRGSRSAPVLDTMFSPLQTVIRAVGDSVVPILRAHPDLANATLSAVTDRLVEYIGRIKDLGIDGLFLSVNGAVRDDSAGGLTAEEFRSWVAPHDKRVLQAADGLIRTIHVHGYHLVPELVADYPAEVLSWSHHYTQPNVTEVAQGGPWAPMGGLDELASLYWPPSRVRQGISAALEATGGRLIVAPGCTVHSDTPPSVLRALRESVEPGGSREE